MTLTAAQLEIRKTRIGSSEIGTVLGLDPHHTVIGLVARKTLPQPEEAPSDEQRWGHYIEPVILAWGADHDDLALSFPGTLIHPAHDHVCATPDAIAYPKATPDDKALGRVQEAKSVGWYLRGEWGDEGDDAPLRYLAQVQFEIGCARALNLCGDYGDLRAAVGGEPPRVYRVPYDAETFAVLVERAREFVDRYIVRGETPDLDGSKSATEYVKQRFRKQARPELLPPDDEVRALYDLGTRNEARGRMFLADAEAAKNKIKLRIGEARGIEGVATWKADKNGKRTFRWVDPPAVEAVQ